MDKSAGAVNIFDFQLCTLGQRQSAGIDGGQTSSIAQELKVAQGLTYLITAEDDGKFLFMAGADKRQRWPGTLNGVFIEEFDPAKGDRAGAAAPFFDVFAVQKAISQFLFGDFTRGFVEVFAQLTHGGDIKCLSTFAVASKF